MCAQSSLTLWDLTDCSLPGSSVHGISQVRILEWGLELPFPTPGIFLTQGSNPRLQCLLRWQADSLPLGSQYYGYWRHKFSNFPGGSVGKESAHNAGDLGSIPGSGWSPGEGNSNPLQYSCPEIPWTEEPGRLQSMVLQSVGHDWATNTWIESLQAAMLWLSQNWKSNCLTRSFSPVCSYHFNSWNWI